MAKTHVISVFITPKTAGKDVKADIQKLAENVISCRSLIQFKILGGVGM